MGFANIIKSLARALQRGFQPSFLVFRQIQIGCETPQLALNRFHGFWAQAHVNSPFLKFGTTWFQASPCLVTRSRIGNFLVSVRLASSCSVPPMEPRRRAIGTH